jgi:agmatinase
MAEAIAACFFVIRLSSCSRKIPMTATSYPAFLASELGNISPDDALFHIIPVPYEKSVSYGTGTAGGPSAILQASQQLELFDGFSIPAKCGIHTHRPVTCDVPYDIALQTIAGCLEAPLAKNRIPILLGGEHTVTVGAMKALQARFSVGDIGIVQFDAHADLRDTYEGSPFSHACVMHRALDMDFRIHQIGIRSLSFEEALLRRQQTQMISWLDAREIAFSGLPEPVLPADFPDTIYITIDIDVLDPSLMPATGTPEPGGLNWYQLIRSLEHVVHDRKVIGFDVVELSPINGLHAADYTSARLIYT